MEKEENVVYGPPLKEDIFLGSVAEYMIPLMRKQPDDFIIQVDALTGEKITSRNFLKLCLEFTEGLVKFGVQKGDVIVHGCPNSILCQSTALGIIFSGAIFSGIDHTLKPFEIQHLLKQFQPKYLICERTKSEEMRENVKKIGLDTKIILLDYGASASGFFTLNDIKTNVDDIDEYKPRKVDDPKKDVVVISCSSGSTGLPKGVALSHYSLLYNNIILSSLDALQFDTSILVTSDLFWISGIMFLFLTSAFQQTRIIPKSTKPEHLLESIEKYRPDFVFLSPPAIMFLVDHPNFKNTNLTSVKCLFTGGSSLGTSIIDKVKAAWKGVLLYQGYGMTELAGPVSSVNPGDDLLSVGRLVPDTQMKIIDPDTDETLGPNKVGECRFKADRIMIGYYNNEEATKAAFDKNGWLKTGDLAYYTEEGLIYIVGRIKDAIKYRNYQVSLVEIESYILGLPGVLDAAIVPMAHGIDYNLKAIVVKKAGSKITADDIIESVKKNFSEYKHLKEGVEFVDVLPRSEVGKLKRWVLNEKYGRIKD